MSKLIDFLGGPEGIISKYEEFTVSGTWTKDPAATWVAFHIVAAGGAGGDSMSGAGGQGLFYIVRASDISTTETVTVGSGSELSSGGDSSFLGYVAKGGNYDLYSTGGFNFSYGHSSDIFDSALRTSRSFFEGFGSAFGGGDSIYGGGGGSGGKSIFAGNGGAGPESGQTSGQPGQFPGGGGAENASGADGAVRIWQW